MTHPTNSKSSATSSSSVERRWTALDVRGFHWRCWQGEHVLYSALTGDTHLLDTATAEILKTLQRGPATNAELLDHLSRQFPDEALDSPMLTRLLDDLYKLGLVDVFRGDSR